MMRMRIVIVVVVVAVAAILASYVAFHRRPPVAMDDRSTTASGTPVAIDVLANDNSPTGDPLVVTKVTAAKNGEVSILPDGKVEYRPHRLFFGQDAFGYAVGDRRGGEATAQVTVDVKLELPRFLRRRGSASLSEMMQQPPTNIYGSSINLFVYSNVQDGGIAEVVVTGHADSLTCSQISGAVMGTLLSKRASADEFTIAGTGRVLGGSSVTAESIRDPAIQAFRDAAQALKEAEITNADPNELQALKVKVQQAEADPKVQAFVAAAVSQPALESLLREAERLSATSGLVRVHRLPQTLRDQASARIAKAVGDKVATIVEFRDLIAPEQEAAIIMPMLSTRTGNPIVIDVPAGEFSQEGFAEAVAQHRDAVETAIVGNARSRAELATEKLQENVAEQQACTRKSPDELAENVQMNVSCTADGCIETRGETMTRREYCSNQLPKNKRLVESWLKEAQAILAQLRADRESRGGKLDEFTHAALIDSMLRDWALPVGDVQAAFDHWRVNRRSAAWEILTRELDRMGVDRRVLMGENVAFLATIGGDRLKIRPIMVIDLLRSVVVVDEQIGATAVVDAWSERRDGQPTSRTSTALLTLASLSQAVPDVRANLETDPANTMKSLWSMWDAEISRTDSDRDQRLAKANEIAAFQSASEIATRVATLDGAGYDEWKKEVIPVINDLLDSRHVSAETLLRAALSIAKRVVTEDSAVSSLETPAAWQFLTKVANGSIEGNSDDLPRFHEIEDHFGVAPSKVIYDLITKRARLLDAKFIDTALKERAWPKEASALEQKYRTISNTPQSRIDLEVSATHMISSALKQRSLVLASYRILLGENFTGPMRWKMVSQYLKQANEIESTDDASGAVDAVLAEVRTQQQNPTSQDTIVRQQLASRLSRIANGLLNIADAYDRRDDDLYSPDHERLSARVAFENGAYADALRRYFGLELPVALWLPNLTWQILDGDFKGVPDELRSTLDASELLLSVRRGGNWSNVIRIKGAEPDALQRLGTTLVAQKPHWQDGELISDQILTTQLPIRSELAEGAKAIRAGGTSDAQGRALWLPLLKAMVYGCVPPAGDVVDLSGRCSSETDTVALHDRVANSGSATTPLDPDELRHVAQTKFAVP
jgi:hypothetical protein